MVPRLRSIVVLSLLLFVACNTTPRTVHDGNDPDEMVSVAEIQGAMHDLDQASIPTLTQTVHVPLPTRTLIPTATLAPTREPEPGFILCSPLEYHPLETLTNIISDPYKPPPAGKEERHHGVDFGYWNFGERTTMQGEPVQSVLPGTVASVLPDKYPYGNMAMVETQASYLPEDLQILIGMRAGDSLYVLYAHLDKSPLVEIGEEVQVCQPLGEVGLSGNTDIAHLHLETRLGPQGTVFSSMLFYSTRATIEEMENYIRWRTSGDFRHFDPMILLTFP
jgi:murein DD-endopeptidase MepM/ murein hydrolase activator NlpD